MKKAKHILYVLFKGKDSSLLYNGSSFVSTILSDDVLITRNKIEIVFHRTKKIKKSEVLDSPNSIIRMHLQKCLCFYLSVIGEIPTVKSVTFISGTESVEIEHERFTQTWKNCHAEIRIPANNAKCIFDGGREHIFYVMLTYFLKAQLDNFSHDRFRAAWSALNAMYNYIAKCKGENDAKEYKKLRLLMQIIDEDRTKNSVNKAKELDEDFWKSVGWYDLLTHEDKGKLKERFCDCYDDKYLLELIKNHALGIALKTNIEDINDDFLNTLDRKIKKNKAIPVDRLKFIIRKECYSRRNRSFHAEKPYPLFVISNDNETNIEKTLTEIVLLLFKDLYILFSGNKNEVLSV